MALIDPALITQTYHTSRVLYVNQLATTDKKDVEPIFAEYGLESFQSKPQPQNNFGYLVFKDHESAERALKEKNYTPIAGQAIHLYWADEETKKLKQERANTVILKGINPKIDISNLHQNLQNVGEVINVTINNKNKNETTSTNAYVQFRDPEAAEQLFRASPITINNEEIKVEKYVFNKSGQDHVITNEDSYTKVYFNSLPETYADETKIKELIGTRGNVTTFQVVGKQAALVIVESHEQALRCVHELNGIELEGSKIRVERAWTKSEFEHNRNKVRGGPARTPNSQRGGYRGGGRGGYQPRIAERGVKYQPNSEPVQSK